MFEGRWIVILFTGLLLGIVIGGIVSPKSVIADSGTTNNFYYGNNISMVGHNHTQDLNITSNVIHNNITADSGIFNYIDMAEIVEPGAPSADILRLFVVDESGFSRYSYKDANGVVRSFNDDEIIVKNVRGSTIAAHRIVYVTGNDAGIPTVDLAKSDSIDTMPAIGVTIESIANNGFGRVMQVGQLLNVNTNSYNLGLIYVSDSTAGIPTNTPPVTPSLTQEIGTILVKDAAVGKIQIISRALTGDEFGTVNNFTIVENCSANFITANSFFGDGGNLTNITAAGDGYAGDTGHPHNQDLNSSSTPSFPLILIEDELRHAGDSNTNIVFRPDDISITAGGNIGLYVTGSGVTANSIFIDGDIIQSSDADTMIDFSTSSKYIQFVADGTNRLQYGAPATIFNQDSQDVNFRVETDGNANAFYLDGGDSWIGLFANTRTASMELDLNGDAEFNTHQNQCDERSKRIIWNLEYISDDKILELCRMINYYVYEWQDPMLYEINWTWNTEGYGIGVKAQELYWQLKNFTSNEQLNDKIANAIVSVGNETVLWAVKKDLLTDIYARAWQINDNRLIEQKQHIQNLEQWALKLNDVLPPDYDFEPIPWE